MTKRICLFAGYHPKGQVAEYVVYYLKALSALADVYYWADCAMPTVELDKLAPYVKGVWAKRHNKYDFGSWQELIKKIGWDTLAQYDECIFANDSVFAPLFPLEPILAKGTSSSADAWALNSFERTFFASYFFVIKNQLFSNLAIRHFFENVVPQNSVEGVITHYEKRLVQLIQDNHFTCKVFLNDGKNIYDYWQEVILAGLPVLKVGVFTRDYYDSEWWPNWRTFLQQHSTYPIYLIERHLQSLGLNPDSFSSCSRRMRSLWIRLRRWRQKVFRIRFCKGEKHIVLFGISLLNNTASAKETTDLQRL